MVHRVVHSNNKTSFPFLVSPDIPHPTSLYVQLHLSVIRHNDRVEGSLRLAIFFPFFELREQWPRSDSSVAGFRFYSNSPF